jgi:hypothetical protein
MATFTINEFTSVGFAKGSTIPAYAGDQTDQTAITTSGTSQQSAAFSTATNLVRVTSVGGAVRIKFGSNPTATATSLYLADGDSFNYCTSGQAYKVAVIDA